MVTIGRKASSMSHVHSFGPKGRVQCSCGMYPWDMVPTPKVGGTLVKRSRCVCTPPTAPLQGHKIEVGDEWHCQCGKVWICNSTIDFPSWSLKRSP